MWQAARATTAVPAHFSPLRLSISGTPFRRAREPCLVDGSLFASNPAMCALAEARSLFPGEDDFLLICLGRGEAARGFLPVAPQQKRRRIFDFSLTAESACGLPDASISAATTLHSDSSGPNAAVWQDR
jgi:hypothetical protein